MKESAVNGPLESDKTFAVGGVEDRTERASAEAVPASAHPRRCRRAEPANRALWNRPSLEIPAARCSKYARRTPHALSHSWKQWSRHFDVGSRNDDLRRRGDIRQKPPSNAPQGPRRPFQLQSELAAQEIPLFPRRRRTLKALANLAARLRLTRQTSASPDHPSRRKWVNYGIRVANFHLPPSPEHIQGKTARPHIENSTKNNEWSPKSRRPFVLGGVLGTDSSSSKNIRSAGSSRNSVCPVLARDIGAQPNHLSITSPV